MIYKLSKLRLNSNRIQTLNKQKRLYSERLNIIEFFAYFGVAINIFHVIRLAASINWPLNRPI